MINYRISTYAQNMLKERNIKEEWVWEALDKPDWTDIGEDRNIHYFKSIDENGGRILHVIVNPLVSPRVVVTVFFDRRARR
jgi:hypothetical protein